METRIDKTLDSKNPVETRTDKYTEANDKATELTDLQKCLDRLEEKGYNDQFRVEKKEIGFNDYQKKVQGKRCEGCKLLSF